MEGHDYRAIVENTDDLFRARLLQHQKTNESSLMPGSYVYFNGMTELKSNE